MAKTSQQKRDGQVAVRGGPIARALGVLPDEVPRVRSMFIAAALLGTSLVFFYGGANAIFLTRFDSDVLAWVYLVNGFVTILVGVAYSMTSRRLGTIQVLIGSGVVMAATIVALWGWSLSSDGEAVAFVLATWFRVLFIFAVLGLWELASAMFDVRQAKRLFPALALGIMLAFMIGGGLTGLLTSLIGTTGLILLSAIFMALHTGSLVRVLANPVIAEAVAESEQDTPAGPREILGNRFARRLGEMRTVTIMLIYLTEYIFYEQAAATFDTEESLAGFLGGFLAVDTLLMVIVAGVFAGRFISRYGVRVGLAAYPLGVGVLAVAGGLWGSFIGTDGAFFPIATVLYGVGQILVNAIETPVGALMFQPLPAARRMPIRVAVDGWLGSAALILVGVLLLVIQALPFEGTAPLMWIVVLFAVWGVYLAYVLFGHYQTLLRQATTVGFRDRTTEHDSFALLPTFTRLGGNQAGDVEGAVGPVPAIVDALASSEPDLVEVGVRSAEHHLADDPPGENYLGDSVDLGDLVAGLSEAAGRSDVATDVRTDAVIALSVLDSELALGRASELALDIAAVVLALRAGGERAGDAQGTLAAWAASPDPATRSHVGAALQLAGPWPESDASVERLLVSLIGDPDLTVAIAALDAAPLHASPEITAAALTAGRSPRLRASALRALQAAPTTELDSLVAAIGTVDGEYGADLTAQVIPALTRRPTILHGFLQPTSTAIARAAGFTALRSAKVMPPASVPRMVRDDIDAATNAVQLWRDLGSVADRPHVQAVRLMLVDELLARRRVVLSAIRIEQDHEPIDDVETILDRARRDGALDTDRANALEQLDVLLSPELTRIVLPLLEPPTIADAALDGAFAGNDRTPKQCLAALADDERFAPLARRLAAHSHPNRTDGDDMTELIDRVLALRAIDIFSGLPIEIAAELAERAQERHFEDGELMIEAGTIGRELFAVTSGNATVSVDGQPLNDLGAGTVVGELALLDPGPRTARVVADGPCSVLVIDRDTLLELAEQRPQVMAGIAQVLAARMRDANESRMGIS